MEDRPASIRRIKHGTPDAFDELCEEFEPVIRRCAGYGPHGILWEAEDLHQEGRIALWEAAWKWEGKQPFPAFAITLIKNRMVDTIRATRYVHNGEPNAALSLDAPLGTDDDSGAILEVIPGPAVDDTQARAIMGEEVRALLRMVTERLTPLERGALVLHALEYRNTESAVLLNSTPDSINVTLNRARRKLGIKPRVVRPPVGEVVRLYEMGATSKDIAVQYSVSDGTVRRMLRKEGVPIRPRGLNGSRSVFRARLAADARELAA